MYKYKAEYITNYDGDTITFMVDLGFNVFLKLTVILSRVDAPDLKLHEEGALKVKNFVHEKLSTANIIIIETFKNKRDKYGRYIAEVYYDGNNLSDELLKRGLAKRYE